MEKTKTRRRSPGLTQRGNIWWIDKRVKGLDGALRESTGTSNLDEAERYLAKRITEIRNATIYGVRKDRQFGDAAVKYLEENTHKRSLHVDAEGLRSVLPFIGNISLHKIHDGTVKSYINHELSRGISQGTINRRLKVVRRILNLAARSWRDDYGLTWLETAPLITLPDYQPKKSYVLSWEEQSELFKALPHHLERACLFDINCGAREQEVCQLRWQWEVKVGEYSLFVLPSEVTKTNEERVLIPNNVAQSVINSVRSLHPEFVFAFRGRPMKKLNTKAWQRAWRKVGLPLNVRHGVHNLRHTYATRLRAAGVCFEDRQDLLGHRNGNVTTHYSQVEISNLIDASNKANDTRTKPMLMMANVRGMQKSKNPTILTQNHHTLVTQ